MRFRTLEIRWHDSKPISTCDFQPITFKKARPQAGQDMNWPAQSYRLATGGEDNHVRIWMVHPNIRPSTLAGESESSGGAGGAPRPPRVEYLATLSRHSAAVNVVRFSPNGELIASAGDDGMIIIWAPSSSPQAATYGSDLSPEDMQHEKEFWKPRITFRCTTMQVYDLAWSPTGEYIIAGSTDNAARVFNAADGKCVHEIAEHSHYVQGVAWDPLNEYIATQSSDRSMHIYRISTKQGTFEAHAVGKNTKMPHRHHRGSSQSRPRMFRSESVASDAESVSSEYQFPSREKEDLLLSTPSTSSLASGLPNKDNAPLTPASVASTPSVMFPPPPIEKGPSSRRSSFSSQAPGSPSTFNRYGRSPSPMPPLPAIRNLPATWSSAKLYGDESFTNFFRRLTFSPDGGLLLTPAGQFEDPSHIHLGKTGTGGSGLDAVQPQQQAQSQVQTTPARGRKGRPASISTISTPTAGGTGVGPVATTASTPAAAGLAGPDGISGTPSNSCVYIYSRANFARPPIAQLPGHKKASVAVKFSPILYELRQGVEGGMEGGPGASSLLAPASTHISTSSALGGHHDTKVGVFEKNTEGVINIDIVGPTTGNSNSGMGPAMDVDDHHLPPLHQPVLSTSSSSSQQLLTPQRTPTHSHSHSLSLSSSTSSVIGGGGTGSIAAPAPRLALSSNSVLTPLGNTMPSPALSPMDLRPATPSYTSSKPSTPGLGTSGSSSHALAAPTTSSVFALPYRMLFAVVTMDTVTIYDTQQAGPICLLTKLHYDEFTDMSWSPDGQCLILTSRDGYCTIVIFDEILPTHPTQQHSLQLQSIAHQLTLPITYSNNGPPPSATHQYPIQHQHSYASTPSQSSQMLPSSGGLGSATVTPILGTVGEPPLTPAASVDGDHHPFGSGSTSGAIGGAGEGVERIGESSARKQEGQGEKEKEPPKKKRRVALTRVGDLGS
ncbi:hypothetical protein BDN72DRAFT_814927 [Pluteus cervinus]|uniref:Uncharacterized protein n=1 Tax=Pluteus cervinus TaxID=181527 RepID=A0ACD3B5M4_9AGAR|nr:hypothetical protein BDN72DRAFT_814927 [Pluteus cervinus]